MGEGADDRLAALRSRLLERLSARALDVEEGIVAAGIGIGLTTAAESEDRERLRAAARELVAMIGEVVERGSRWTPELPPAVAAEVRGLARIGIGLEAVMRGYYATSALCLEFASSEGADLPEGALPYLIEVQRWHGDALLAIVAAEFNDELARLERSPSVRRRGDQVRRLLAGELVDAPDLDYGLDGWHVALVVLGAESEPAMKWLAERLGCRLLTVAQEPGSAWAWLGSGRSVPFEELARTAPTERLRMTCGEAREGLAGWRLSHREATAALDVMRRGNQRFVRCVDVALEAGILREEALRRALTDAYLRPLGDGRESQTLRDTLRAYFGCDLNAASTAAALGVDRHTVQRRLRRVEELIGRPLRDSRAEIEVALRVGER